MALMGLAHIAQGMAFKDAPTIQSILEQYGKDKTDFKLVHVKLGVYKWSYTIKGQEVDGVLMDRVQEYAAFMEPGFVPPPFPKPKDGKHYTQEELQAYMDEANKPKKSPRLYIHSFNTIDSISKDLNLSKKESKELSEIILKKCYNLNIQKIQQINTWAKSQGTQSSNDALPEKQFGYVTFAAGNGKLPDSDSYLSMVTINRMNFGGTPNRDGWNQFCRDQD